MEEEIWKGAFENGDVKIAINNLIWMYGHPLMTLAQADKLASQFHQEFNNYCFEIENKQKTNLTSVRDDC